MSRSNYLSPDGVSEVHEDDSAEVHETRCNVCKGVGIVMISGWESDCIECEGFGSIIS